MPCFFSWVAFISWLGIDQESQAGRRARTILEKAGISLGSVLLFSATEGKAWLGWWWEG